MRLAVIADIHGNVLALEAVLADIDRRGADLTIDLGDCVSGPLWPAETYALLQHRRFPTVRGNHDRALIKVAPQQGRSDAFAIAALAAAEKPEPSSWEHLARTEMTPAACRALAALPPILEPLPGVIAFHGTPADDAAYLLEDVVDGSLTLASAAAIARRLGATTHQLVLCAHSHQPRTMRSGASLIVNPGSVGCPAYADPTPSSPHVSETGSPHARYALLDNVSGRWTVDHIAVAYDWTRAAERAHVNNRSEWAMALSTGRVR